MERLLSLLACKAASRRLAEGALEDAPFLHRLAVQGHLLICRHCRRFRRQLLLIGRAARDWASGLAGEKQVRALEERVLKALTR